MEPVFKLSSTNERLKEIVLILIKYGIADWLSNSNIGWINKYLKKTPAKGLEKYSFEERVRMAITELGTTFIKLGQLLSTRTDLISPELAKELSKLQSSTPPNTLEQVQGRIQSEFGIESIHELFASFKEEALASASIAQVHKARLHTGEEVVVKVMHEGVEKKVKEDLNIMTKLAGIAQKHGGPLKAYQPLAVIRQFSYTMLNELDFGMELSNLERFRHNFEGDTRVYFPKPYQEQSGKTVLTMSFLEGVSASQIDELGWSAEQKSHFTEESADIFMEMMFRDQFFHADPHPGNLFIRNDGSLGVLDCGMVAKIDQRTNQIFEEVIIGVAQKDIEKIKDTILEMASVPESADYEALSIQIDQYLEKYVDLPLNQLDMSAAISDGIKIIQTHHLTIPSNVSSLLRVVVMLEGTSRLLNPNFNITVLFKKYHAKILRRRHTPKALVNRMAKNIHQWEQVTDQLPKTMNKFLRLASKENFEINLEHRNLEKSVNRIVMGLLSSSIFVGSSLMWAFKVPPQVNGYSLVGIAGIIFSGILAYTIVRDIKRR